MAAAKRARRSHAGSHGESCDPTRSSTASCTTPARKLLQDALVLPEDERLFGSPAPVRVLREFVEDYQADATTGARQRHPLPLSRPVTDVGRVERRQELGEDSRRFQRCGWLTLRERGRTVRRWRRLAGQRDRIETSIRLEQRLTPKQIAGTKCALA